MSIAFLVTALVVVATPGTGVIYTLSVGISRGRAASVVAAAGCTLGILPHLAVTITGLAALLRGSPLLFGTLKWLGAGYLLWLAWTTLTDRDAIDTTGNAASRSVARTIGTAVGINLLNPKLTIFFVAFLPQFVPASGPGSVPLMLAYGAVFMLLTLVVFTGYGLFAGTVRVQITRRPAVLAWFRRVFAATFVALGAKLALGS